jgi:hypothetical protein
VEQPGVAGWGWVVLVGVEVVVDRREVFAVDGGDWGIGVVGPGGFAVRSVGPVFDVGVMYPMAAGDDDGLVAFLAELPAARSRGVEEIVDLPHFCRRRCGGVGGGLVAGVGVACCAGGGGVGDGVGAALTGRRRLVGALADGHLTLLLVVR